MFSLRSIPACTGEPLRMRRGPGCPGVHPRVYGGATIEVVARVVSVGPSPRVRGSPRRGLLLRKERRSIPACTGEPPARRWRGSHPRVHPRVYGGAGRGAGRSVATWGPSPRVRGSLVLEPAQLRFERSIPACTGEPPATPTLSVESQVHPRVYGGAGRWVALRIWWSGPSPRVRGSRVTAYRPACLSG